MIIQDGRKNLEEELFLQLSSYWKKYNRKLIQQGIESALGRLDIIFQALNRQTNKYVWQQEHESMFSPYNSVQYSIFLYLLSNSVYNLGGGNKGGGHYLLPE